MASVVWFKKDLRTHDHQPLFLATHQSPVIGLYIVEPEWVVSYEYDDSHWQFLKQSLTDLRLNLKKWNIPLVIRFGPALNVFSQLHKEWPFQRLYSHQETGVDWTFRRDLRVKEFAKSHGIQWKESLQFGVFRALKNRDEWMPTRQKWLRDMTLQPLRSQALITSPSTEHLEDIEQHWGAKKTQKTLQQGGETEALKTLSSFLSERGQTYLADISKPHLSKHSGSRLSPYLSYGNLSLREIHRQTQSAKNEKRGEDWRKSFWAFESRLWWHCHFIQKLESEPRIEFENMNKAFNSLRESEFREDLFEAWKKGQTGFPIIDAVMRCLLQTGWINFRMRAMLVSFASYQLWLHWQKPAQFLAKHFLDFEPGIHFSQFQMQSGVTGINAIRIYSPQKQTKDQDPSGDFIRTFCPELKDIPDIYLSDPQSTPPLIQMEAGCMIGRDYPEPIVDGAEAYKKAKERIYGWKGQQHVRVQSKKVYLKHGSRDNKHFPKQKRDR